MSMLSGGKSAHSPRLSGTILILESSINKLIGESFKLHAQALSGYEDSLAPHTVANASTPTMSSLGVEPELETAY